MHKKLAKDSQSASIGNANPDDNLLPMLQIPVFDKLKPPEQVCFSAEVMYCREGCTVAVYSDQTDGAQKKRAGIKSTENRERQNTREASCSTMNDHEGCWVDVRWKRSVRMK